MGLYLGSGNENLRIFLNGVAYKLNLYSTVPILNGAMLFSSDNYVLKDSNGKYLTIAEEYLVEELGNDT